MLASKAKSGVSDAANIKITPGSRSARQRPAMLGALSPSLQKNKSFSIDGSPKLAESKPMVNRRSSTKKSSPTSKVSEQQVQHTAVEEDLKKAKEQLSFNEMEKAHILKELSETRNAFEKANEKLADALLAQKKAEESSELDKFRADELEQSVIEAARKREEEWLKELDDIRNQHAFDVSALISVSQELQKAKQELEAATDAKDRALGRADDAMELSKNDEEKAAILYGEIDCLRALLHSQIARNSNETAQMIEKLGSDAEALKLELSKARAVEKRLAEMQALVEGLEIELTDARRAESDAVGFAEEWSKKTEILESCLEGVKESEKSARDSLVFLTKQVKETNSMHDDAESEVASLKGKVEALELELARQKAELEGYDNRLDLVKKEVMDIDNTAAILKSEIQRMEEDKTRALNNEKLASSNVGILAQENLKLTNELGGCREDSEKAKNEMDGLLSTFHGASIEAKDMQEKLLVRQMEVDRVTGEVDKLYLALKVTQETYQVMLDESKYEIVCLKKAIEKCETEADEIRTEWDAKEINLRTTIRNTDEEAASILLERDQVAERLERQTVDGNATAEKAQRLQNKIRQAESELIAANHVVEKAKAENRLLKERLLDKENEIQCIAQENADFRILQTTSAEKIKELSESLAKLSFKRTEENSDARQSLENGSNRILFRNGKVDTTAAMNSNKNETGNSEELSEEAQGMVKVNIKLEDNDAFDAEALIYEGGDAVDCKPLLPCEMERRDEPDEDKFDAKNDFSSQFPLNHQCAQNGSTLPSNIEHLQKKKKAFLGKWGLLKKKAASK